jgi:hypothetical protein
MDQKSGPQEKKITENTRSLRNLVLEKDAEDQMD